LCEELDRRYVGDITYISTWEGWAYLATVIDLASRKVVGWAIADHMRTELVEEALEMAFVQRRPPEGVIFHSDRGCHYPPQKRIPQGIHRMAASPVSRSRHRQ
jgi:transposase InsO family protein